MHPPLPQQWIEDGWNQLLYTAGLGNSRRVEYLLDLAVIDINTRAPGDWTPLMLAADGPHWRTVKILIKRGAIVSAGGGGPEGYTALHVSPRNNDLAVTSILLNADADVSAKTSRLECTPLHIAAERGHFRAIEVLVRGGANVDDRMPDGSTALFIAAQKGNPRKPSDTDMQEGVLTTASSHRDGSRRRRA